NCWEQWTRGRYSRVETGYGATRKTTRREDRRIVWKALVDPTVTQFNDTSGRRRRNCSTNNFQTPAESNLKSKCPFRALL
ncbi:hypothetical protein TNCV_4094581, partial [Trichonephila clavipes]